MSDWERFISQLKKDLKQWMFFMLTLTFFRIVFVAYFRIRIEEVTPWTALIKALVNGIRYDSMAATYFILLPLLLSVLCGFIDLTSFTASVRRGFGAFFLILSTVLSIVSIEYFREYNDQFNHFIFNLYYDDTRAILSTIWADYRVLPNLVAISVVSALIMKLYRLFMASRLFEKNRGKNSSPGVPFRVVFGLALTALLVIGARGSYGHRPAKREDAAVTRDVFLNKAVLNPYSAGMYAFRIHKKLANIAGGLETYLPDRNVKKAAQELFGDYRSFKNLDEYFRRTASGGRNERPKHIFLVVMESYDAWPLMEKYASLGLTSELARIARKGIHVKYFLPASDGTATSFCALVSGLPDSNAVINYRKSSKRPYPSSITQDFKRLGYRTRFFYGGYLSWQKIGDFARGQGFDEIYGAAHIGSWASHNEWGVEDENLFNFIVSTLEPASAVPSLNVIMTTSYHPPYELDVYRKGFPLRAIPEDLAALYDGSVKLKTFGHLWYSDRCIGEFVRIAEKKFEKPLFAFTGDHYSRRFINTLPDQYEKSAVPFILYGEEVLRGVPLPENPVGSHIDIAPTLIELAAPKGFPYYAIGRNLLGSRPNRFGISKDYIISSQFLFEVYSGSFHPLPGKPLPDSLPDPGRLKLLHHRQSGVAWWRVMRGEKL